MDITPVRIFFSKTGRAKYISHLDTMRTFTRTLRRSGLPLWYTQGFNPHLYITFALPIPLGCEGLRESFDIRLTSPVGLTALEKAISAVMPDGFSMLHASEPVMEPSSIHRADYVVRLIYPETGREAVKVWDSLAGFEARPMVEVLKKTKKGEQLIDIRPHVELLSKQMEGSDILLTLRTAAGISLNINPILYLKAFYAWSGSLPEGVRLMRTAVLDENLRDFG